MRKKLFLSSEKSRMYHVYESSYYSQKLYHTDVISNTDLSNLYSNTEYIHITPAIPTHTTGRPS